MIKKRIPNVLTIARILLSIGLIFLDYRRMLFLPLYLLCGLTDSLDGFLARRWKCETSFGARLDSFADFTMTVLIVILLLKQKQITTFMLMAILVIFIIRLANAVIAKIRFNKPASVHTYLNKLTGLLLFFCPVTYAFIGTKLLWITGIFAGISAIEETTILLTSKELDLDRKGFFF